MTDVDKHLPALNYAVELQKTTASVGFDWPHISGVVEKIHEELEEVLVETKIDNNQDRLHDEIGDLLFACTNLARHLNIDPQQAMMDANTKFYRRFNRLELVLAEQGKTFDDCSLEQLDSIWDKIKHKTNKK